MNQLGEGPPGREQVVNEQLRRQMMAANFKRQEELKVSVHYARLIEYEFLWCFRLLRPLVFQLSSF